MICWRTQSGGVPAVPACLEAWEPRAGAQLVHRETDKGHVVYVGDPVIWTPPRAWHEAEEGWQVGAMPGITFEPRLLTRVQGWVDVGEAQDMHRRIWLAPHIRRPGGGRAFRVAYGRNWLPSLTPDQARSEEICAAAVDAANQDTPMAIACQWAAELLSMTHHVTPDVLAALALVDDALAVATLRVALSLEVETGAANGV
jgi:hypothetical protein